MIFVTGDCHADFNRFNKSIFPEQNEMTKEANGNEVDFIVSHCCSSSTQVLLGGGLFRPDYLTNYFEEIRRTVKFKKWFFGHYHDNRNVNTEELLVYEQIVRIW